ncbi:hypothetical protein K0M31_010247, partial [Melipona bicolor]
LGLTYTDNPFVVRRRVFTLAARDTRQGESDRKGPGTVADYGRPPKISMVDV